MGYAVWQTEFGGVLVACELGRPQFAVERASGWVRHTVHRHRGSAERPSPTLIAISNRDSVQAVMRTAESGAEGRRVIRQADNAGAGHCGSARDHAA